MIDDSSPEVCINAPLLDVETRLLSPFATPALETLRQGLLELISRDELMERHARGILLTAYRDDFKAILRDLLEVPAAILKEIVCRRRKLFAMDTDLLRLTDTWFRARRELRAMGLTQSYADVLEVRATSTSPQMRLSAACATVLLAALLADRETDTQVTAPLSVVTAPSPTTMSLDVDTTVSEDVCTIAPLLDVETRLLSAFPTRGLEELRRGVIDLISRDDQTERRVRGILLTALRNDFVSVFADLLDVPVPITREIVCHRRKLFAMTTDLERHTDAWNRARRELAAAGLSPAYSALLEARATSSSPQHRLTAACATLLFAGLLFVELPPIIEPPDPTLLATEASEGLLSEGGEALEVT